MDGKRASEELMDLLHGTVAQGLYDQIRAYLDGNVLDAEGVPQPLPASLVAQAIKFLKDNHIDSPQMVKKGPGRLAELLDSEEFDNVVYIEKSP